MHWTNGVGTRLTQTSRTFDSGILGTRLGECRPLWGKGKLHLFFCHQGEIVESEVAEHHSAGHTHEL